MKVRVFVALFAAIPCLNFAAALEAATITWDAAQNITTSTEVSTEGTLVIARQMTGGTGVPPGNADQTVNGVTFSGTVNTQNGVTFGISGFSNADPASYMSTKQLAGPDADAYERALAGGWYTAGATTANFSFSGLTVTQQYLVQVWVADYRSFPNDRNQTVDLVGGTDTPGLPTLLYLGGDGTNPGTGRGQFVIGRFTADNANMSFNLLGNQSSQLNAVQLRAIPEPSSLVLLGIASFAMLRLRRRSR